jgi:glycosyltransferase involved in cell wall biosynthesis
LKLGGTTTFLCNFGGELIRRHVPAEVLSFELENPLASDFARQNIPVTCLDDGRHIFEDQMGSALAALRAFRPTTVLATLGTPSFEVLRYVPAGVFRVGVAQSDDPPLYPGVARYAGHLDAVVVVSGAMKHKMLAQPALTAIPVHAIPYGVPMPDVGQIIHPDAVRPLRILYLGRLVQEQKRVRLFPKILRSLCASGIPFHWTIAGDGPEMAFLKASMKTSSPGQQVTFLGPVAYANVPGVLRRHDVFLLASDYEGLPLSLLEAMGHGLVPVVSNLTSGIPEVVDETNGRLVPVDDVAGYARAIVHLHTHRAELAAKSAAARQRVQSEFSVTAMTDRWLAIIPPATLPAPTWLQADVIQAPLPSPRKFLFSPPVRPFRRLAKNWRSIKARKTS